MAQFDTDKLLLTPPMIATGVARMRGQGVAITRMASTRSASRVNRYATAHASNVIGVNQTAYRSASR